MVMITETKHPLLNSDSRHYDNDGDMPDIYYMEKDFPVLGMIYWCKGNIYKYKARQDKKGQKEGDLKKIRTYENYINLLETLDIYSTKSTRELLDDKYIIDYEVG